MLIEMAGHITDGMVGTGFLYTNKESLSIGVGCMLGEFKNNPCCSSSAKRHFAPGHRENRSEFEALASN